MWEQIFTATLTLPAMTQSPNPQQPTNPKESGEKLSIADQFAEIAIKALRPGGMTAGGIGAFWFLFQESDLPKALASAGIGLGISYAANMLQPIHEGNQRRLQKAGKAIDQAIDRTTDQVFAKATGFEEKYLVCQGLDCQDYKTEGMEQRIGLFTPLLREVFVPLKIGSEMMQPGFCPEVGGYR